MLEAGISASMKDDLNCSALHYACQNDNLVLVEQLLQVLSLEDINFFDDRGRTPVSILVARPTPPNEKTLRALVEKGGDLNVLSEVPILDHFRRGFNPGDVRQPCMKYSSAPLPQVFSKIFLFDF